jgi:hypothetical protein
MGFLNLNPTNKRFEGSRSHIRLHAWGDGYCKTANELSDLRVFYLEKSNNLDVIRVKGHRGNGGNARQQEGKMNKLT